MVALKLDKLFLNVNKTKLMVFHSCNTVLYPKLRIDAIDIERVDFNFPGLQLNHNLKWNKHIKYVSLKMSKITGLLHKLKSMYPISILKSICNIWKSPTPLPSKESSENN